MVHHKNDLEKLSKIDELELRPIDTAILEKVYDDVDAARKMYFSEYEPHRIKYESLIKNLVEAASQTAYEASGSLEYKNIRSMLNICVVLVLGIFGIAVAIRILAAQVELTQKNMRSLLAVLGEGLFFFDRMGQIAPERSQALAKILPGSDSIKTLAEFASRYSRVTENSVATCLKLLWGDDKDGFMSDFDSTISLLPKEFLMPDNRVIHVEYRALNNSNQQLDKIVVVVTDVTIKLKNEREIIAQSERVRKISKVAAGVESYLSFVEEAAAIFKRADSGFNKAALSKDDLVQLKRDLHTLKGSTGTYDFDSLAAEIHHLESEIEENGISEGAKSQWDRIKDQWKFEISDVEQVLGLRTSKEKIPVPKEKIRVLAKHASASNDTKLGYLLDELCRQPLRELFAKYENYVTKLAERRNEKQVRFDYVQDSIDLAPLDIQSIDIALSHIFRNCLDHGIE